MASQSVEEAGNYQYDKIYAAEILLDGEWLPFQYNEEFNPAHETAKRIAEHGHDGRVSQFVHSKVVSHCPKKEIL